MNKRTVAVFACIMLLFCGLYFRLLQLVNSEGISSVAAKQSAYQLTVSVARGTIYDCNGLRMTNQTDSKLQLILPTKEAIYAIQSLPTSEEKERILQKLSAGYPTYAFDLPISGEGVTSYSYWKNQNDSKTAIHLLGYLNAEGDGITGIQKSYNDWLKDGGRITVSYSADALGRILLGENTEINNLLHQRQGVRLTLDAVLQKKIEQLFNGKSLQGCVIVTDISNGEIKTLASFPNYSSNTVNEALSQKHSPFLNRALTAYNVGSVFKLVVAQTALEKGIAMEYLCDGVTDFHDIQYQCIGKTAHGCLNLPQALSVSCNCYFIRLAELCGGASILKNAVALGFGKSITLAEGIRSEEGKLPTASELEQIHALANFSFGQGSMLATPLQISFLINTIANGGVRVPLKLVLDLVDAQGNLLEENNNTEEQPTRVMEESIARQLQSFMIQTVSEGSASTAYPNVGGAGAKTATAETGWYLEGKQVIETWCAGFYPAEAPRYSIVVMIENGNTGSSTCGPYFKRIADILSEYYKLPLTEGERGVIDEPKNG